VAATFHLRIETAQLRGEDPAACLPRAAVAAIANPGTLTLPTATVNLATRPDGGHVEGDGAGRELTNDRGDGEPE